jgi:hypothetical protein
MLLIVTAEAVVSVDVAALVTSVKLKGLEEPLP